MENLDDGELWLPSDIFPLDDNVHHHNRPTDASRTSMEDLNRPFNNNMNFVNHHNIITTPKIHSITQFGTCGAMSQNAITTTPSNGCYGLTVGPSGVDHCHFNYHPGSVYQIPDISAFHFPLHRPVAEQLMETRRARSTNRPVHRQQQTWLSPLQGVQCQNKLGFGFGFGFGSMKECHSSSTSSGTGVFIPRTTVGRGGKINTDVKSQRGPARKLGTRKGGDYNSYHSAFPSSEVGLPKDWTY